GGSPISVLHLLCHGGAAGQTCGLVLDGEDAGEPTLVDAGRLRQLLAPYAGMVRLVVIAACNGGNIGTLGNQLGSIAQALHQIGIGAVIASRFPLSIPGSNRCSESFYRELLGGPSSVESAFLAARRQLARDTSRLDWASLQLYACGAEGHDSRPLVLRPYRGLLAFQPEHSRFFFGRDAEVQELIDALGALAKAGAPRLLVIAGSSGTGKSSVVLAGAVPRMLQQPGATWVFAPMRPGARPMAALDAALASRTEPGGPLLLVVDQFEEVFTQTESVEERGAFARRLWSLAADAGSSVSVLLTLRVDFIGRCGELVLDDKGLRLDKVAYEEAHRVFVAQMTQAQLEEAICRPAQRVGLTLEAGLARRMLQDVEGEPGALPLLQDTLDMLWQQRKGRQLTQAAYDALGGVSGALSRRADARIAALEPLERMIARRLFLCLVNVHSDTAMDTRQRALLADVRPRALEQGMHFDRILDRFVDERLLVRLDDGQATAVEVAHEALIRNWRMLREWVDENRGKLLARQALARKVEEWKQNGALLNEQQLGLAEAAAPDAFEEPGDDARKLLEASRAEVRRKRRLKQFAMAGLAAAAVVSMVLGVWGQQQAATARAQRHLAEIQARHARDIGRVSAARRVASEPDVALTLLREVEAEDPGHVQDWHETALYFVSSPVVHNRTPVELKGHQGPVHSAAFSADGKRMVTLSRDGSARVWNADGSPAGQPLQVAGAKIGSAGFSPDGTRLVTGSTDGAVRVWTVEGAPVGKPFEGHASPVSSAAFSPEGKRIFTASEDGNARVWTAEGRLLSSLPGNGPGQKGQEVPRVQVTFSANGTRLVTLSNGTARLWRADGTPLRVLEGTSGELLSAAFSADGTRLLTLSSTSTRVWTDTGVLVSELPGFG
ncbi:MAG TPA: CHAT domain-containing protein, partial [Archangium sp.]|nr:CHAT domain-containing protein [Archangium sp.]